MTTFYTVRNNVATTTTGYTSGSGSIALASGAGAAFGSSFPVVVSTFLASGTAKGIYSCTGRTGDTLTGLTLLSGTDASLPTGAAVELRWTAEHVAQIAGAISPLETHAASTANPHAVTAAQVGAYTTAQADTLLAAKQPLDADLTALAALSGTGFAKRTGSSTWTVAGLVVGDIPDLSATYSTVGHTHSTADITSGTLGVARGGTGAGSFTTGKLLAGSGTGALAEVTVGSGLDLTSGTLTATGGGGTPGGSSGSIQYNAAGSFGGFGAWDGSTLTVPGDCTVEDTYANGGAVFRVRRSDFTPQGVEILSNLAASADWAIRSTSASGQAGILTEAAETVLSYAINVDQIGTRSASSAGAIFRLDTRAGLDGFHVWRQPASSSLTCSLRHTLETGQTVLGQNADSATPLAQLDVLIADAARPGVAIRGAASQSAPLLKLRQVSSTAAARDCGVIDAVWATATDASRKGRLSLHACDSTGTDREGIRVESDGSAPLLGFFGGSAAAKPTVTGSRGGNAALAGLLTALAALGLITDSTS